MIEGATAPRLSNPWVVLGALLLIYIFNFADRYLITGLVGPIKDEFGVGDGFMGLLMGPAFVALYVLLGVPIARLADRASRVRIITAGCVFWSLSTMLTGLASGPATLALARVGVGIGEAAFVAPAYSLLSDYFKPERRGLAFAILGLATYFGQIAGQGGGPALAAVTSWRESFFIMGAPGIVLGGLALILIREPARTAPATVRTQEVLSTLIKRLIATPSYVLLIFTLGLGSLSGVAFGYWGPELFTRSYGLDSVAAKSAFALNFGGAGLIGILIFGPVADRLSRHRKDAPLRLTAGALFAATSLILVVTWVPDFRVAKLLAIPSGLLGGGWSVGVLVSLQYLLPERFRATATAFFIAIATLLGYLIGPSLTGAVSQSLGDNAESLKIGLSVAMPAGFVGAVCAWVAAPMLDRDRDRLQV